MPIYEYACKSCGFQTEKFQGLHDKALNLCEHCGKDTLERLVSAAGFRLKGAGWYETDFKQGDQKRNLASSEASDSAKAESPKTETAKPESSSEGKTEKKPTENPSGTSKTETKKTSEH